MTRGNPGMNLGSPANNFQASFKDIFGANRSNGLSGGAGQGSIGATYNSSFGNGMFKLSATTMLGSGPGSGSMRPMGGAGLGGPPAVGGAAAHPTAQVSLHLHF
jgi:hypothetical protein